MNVQMSTKVNSQSIIVILIGDSFVGKTNIFQCFSKGKRPEVTMPTVGVEYTSKIIKLKSGIKSKVQIWDTAGQ